jgi:hypothetical protein
LADVEVGGQEVVIDAGLDAFLAGEILGECGGKDE